ncbi:MAG: hypothetical protein DLM68_10990 [Hyphomicrobiales bacterium]|nr:MAG: hypothetical protein DLM68_10990 [Hyphomicrobiales bacterium]
MFHAKHFGTIGGRDNHTGAEHGFVFWAEYFVRFKYRRLTSWEHSFECEQGTGKMDHGGKALAVFS